MVAPSLRSSAVASASMFNPPAVCTATLFGRETTVVGGSFFVDAQAALRRGTRLSNRRGTLGGRGARDARAGAAIDRAARRDDAGARRLGGVPPDEVASDARPAAACDHGHGARRMGRPAAGAPDGSRR